MLKDDIALVAAIKTKRAFQFVAHTRVSSTGQLPASYGDTRRKPGKRDAGCVLDQQLNRLYHLQGDRRPCRGPHEEICGRRNTPLLRSHCTVRVVEGPAPFSDVHLWNAGQSTTGLLTSLGAQRVWWKH